MPNVAIVAVAAIMMLISGSSGWAQEHTWITIDAAGKERGAFVPRTAPYLQNGPSVGVYLFDRQDVLLADGRALTGFEFIGGASYLVAPDRSQSVVEMSALGIQPMVLRSVARSAAPR